MLTARAVAYTGPYDPRVDELDPYRGPHIFGPAYRRMYDHDAHAPGSVDRAIFERMVLLCDATAPALYAGHVPEVRYAPGSRPELERRLNGLLRDAATAKEQVGRIVSFCRSLGDRSVDLVFGGTEEAICERGSDWCTDVARVACVLARIAGYPARLVVLADRLQAYSGHEIVEIFRDGRWGAVDPTSGVVYRHPDGRPASARELARDPRLIASPFDDRGLAEEHTGLFRGVAIAEYGVEEAPRFDFTTSGPNDYYRAILGMSAAGWPGGRRWLFGEDAG